MSRMEPIPETYEAVEEYGPFAAEDRDLVEELKQSSARLREIVPECIGITMSSAQDGISFTLVSSDEEVAVLDAIQYTVGGPCVESVRAERVLAYTQEDFPGEARWQLFAQATAAASVASTLTLPIVGEGTVVGSINLYATTPTPLRADTSRSQTSSAPGLPGLSPRRPLLQHQDCGGTGTSSPARAGRHPGCPRNPDRGPGPRRRDRASAPVRRRAPRRRHRGDGRRETRLQRSTRRIEPRAIRLWHPPAADDDGDVGPTAGRRPDLGFPHPSGRRPHPLPNPTGTPSRSRYLDEGPAHRMVGRCCMPRSRESPTSSRAHTAPLRPAASQTASTSARRSRRSVLVEPGSAEIPRSSTPWRWPVRPAPRSRRR